MSYTWRSNEAPPSPARGGGLRITIRAASATAVLTAGLVLMLLLRLVERPVFGARRPVTPWLVVGVCRLVLVIFGLRRMRSGRPLAGAGAMVANHVSWLDILALNASAPVCFVAKQEVSGWPGIGLLARVTGTVFIRRDRRAAPDQVRAFRERIAAGHRLLLFPEGTSSDGRRVLPFRSTLFAAFMEEDLREDLWLQPVSVVYRAPAGADRRFYGWWGDMGLGPHLRAVLSARRQGEVKVIFHPPLRASDRPDRKQLALACETAVRAGLAHEGVLDPPDPTGQRP